jgi:hypothetical protein
MNLDQQSLAHRAGLHHASRCISALMLASTDLIAVSAQSYVFSSDSSVQLNHETS